MQVSAAEGCRRGGVGIHVIAQVIEPERLRAHATTIVAVKRDGFVAIAGDGQVTVGDVVMKNRATKVRRLYNDLLIAGFAGAVADAFTLFDKFEQQLEKHQGNLLRAAISMSKEWRTDRFLRHLDAMLVVADSRRLLLLSGDGEIIEPDDDITAIGSGGPYAHAAARALLGSTDLPAEEVARRALGIAADLCIYTNSEITIEVLATKEPDSDAFDTAPSRVSAGGAE